MSPKIRNEFQQILEYWRAYSVLEVGATNRPDTLLTLPAIRHAKIRYGVNLEGPYEIEGAEIKKANANKLPFPDKYFDTIVCNATLEHDRKFWLSVAEMKRVAKKDAIIVIGVPGFGTNEQVFPIHNFPGDYYRFSDQAVKFLLEGLHSVEVKKLMEPLRIIGYGYKI
jgi:SAM-dependent methyltransferase